MDNSPDHNDEQVSVHGYCYVIADKHDEDDSGNESVLSCEIIPVPNPSGLGGFIIDEEQVDLAIREIESAIEDYYIYEDTIRNIFRSICAGLSAILNGSITYNHKISEVLPLGSAGRIALRPLFKRAGYTICSVDPCVTRTGLPRSISMPANMTEACYCGGISRAVQRFPDT